MNAMPPMVRHQSTAAPGLHGRSHARADRGPEAFERVLSEVDRGDKPSDEPDGADLLLAADEAGAADKEDRDEADRDEAAPGVSPDVTAGLLPLLRIVLAQEKETGGTPAEDISGAVGRPTGAEAAAEAPDAPQPPKDAASGATVAPASLEPRSATEPRPAGETRPAADTRQATDPRPALDPPAALDKRPAAEARSVAAAAQDDNPRRAGVTVTSAATPQAGGAASAASASLSLLARLNLITANTDRVANAPADPTSPETSAEEKAAASDVAPDDAAPDDAGETTAMRARPRSAGEEPGDGSTGRRELPDGTGRAAERAAPVATSLPQPGQPTSVPAQVVQALAANAVATGPVRTVVAADQDDAAAGGTIQSLKIQLRPHELGQVTAKLSMAGDQLSIEIEVDTIEAHRKLSNESDTIVKALRAQGIAVDQVTIQPPSQPNAAAGDGATADTPAFTGRDARDSGNSGNPAGRNQPYDSPDRDHGQETRSTGESHASGIRSSGGVYI